MIKINLGCHSQIIKANEGKFDFLLISQEPCKENRPIHYKRSTISLENGIFLCIIGSKIFSEKP
jgi:hypothetical protein